MTGIDQWLKEARGLHQSGRMGEAAGLYRKILEVSPDHVEAIFLLATLHAQCGDTAAAIPGFRDVVRRRPRMIAAHTNLGNALLGRGDYRQASESFRSALALDGRSFAAHFGYGCALQALGADAEAERHYRSAQSLQPRDVAVHVNLGTVLMHQGRLDQAVGCYRQALAINPRLSEAHVSLGHALITQRQYGAALECLSRAVELGAQSADVHLGLGDALHGTGDVPAALAHYRRACEIDPLSQNAYLKLDRLLLNSGAPEKQAVLDGLLHDRVYTDWEEPIRQARDLARYTEYWDTHALAQLTDFFAAFRPERAYDAAWWEDRLRLFGAGEDGHDKLLRGVFSAVFSWSIPTQEALRAIADFATGRRVYSYGAGTGYWESFLRRQYQAEIVATDLMLRNRFMEMGQEDYGQAKISPTDVIFLSWILPGDTAVNRVLAQMQPGQRLVLIGEPRDAVGKPRICATPEMFALLDAAFRRLERMPLVSYSRLNDTVDLYERL
ncbi:MAG TPA: tetratricopeptide repeat protein [Gemmatimonadales bacterium]